MIRRGHRLGNNSEAGVRSVAESKMKNQRAQNA